MKIIEIKKITESCPTQWEFKTEDHREGYVRYRFGQLKIYLSMPNQNIDDALSSIDPNYCILWMCLEEGKLDGTLSDERVFHALKLLDFSFEMNTLSISCEENNNAN